MSNSNSRSPWLTKLALQAGTLMMLSAALIAGALFLYTRPLRTSLGGDIVWVESKPGYFKNHTWLHIQSAAGTISCHIDDDMQFGLARLVKRDDWLLVLNDDYCVAGFDLTRRRAYGEYDWDRLPILSWDKRGEVLATKRFGKRGSLPANYRIVTAR